MKHLKASFFVIGVPKGGTGFMHSLFNSDDRIHVPHMKETHYFSTPNILDTYYKVPYCPTEDEFEKQFVCEDQILLSGEVCPSYFSYADTPQRIFDYNHKAKIIIILRNPIDRAISHYLMDSTARYVKEDLLEILTDIDINPIAFEQYTECSKYYKCISNYLNVFPKENILFQDFNDLKNKPSYLVNNVYAFLGITPPKSFKNEKIGGYHKDRFGFYVLWRNFPFLKKISKFSPKGLKTIIRKVLFDTKIEKDKFNREREILNDLLSTDTIKFQEIIPWTKKWTN